MLIIQKSNKTGVFYDPSPDDFEIIDFHAHPVFEGGSTGPYGKPETMEEFDREMKKAGIDRYAGSTVYLREVTEYKDIRKLNEEALQQRMKRRQYNFPP